MSKTDEEILKEDPDLAAMFTDDEDDSLNNDEVFIYAGYFKKLAIFVFPKARSFYNKFQLKDSLNSKAGISNSNQGPYILSFKIQK